MGDPEPRGPAAPAPQGSLRRATLRGSAWSLGGYATSQALRLGGNLVLTRILYPEIFGVMSLLTSILVGLAMLSDVGLGPAIVQRAEGDDPRFLRTAWTIQIVRGAIIAGCMVILAQPVALFYREPRLAWALPLLGLSPLLLGFESTARHTLQRHLRWERLVLFDLCFDALGIAATVAFAAAHRAAYGPNDPSALWTVIGGTLLGQAVRVPMSHLLLPGIPHRVLLDRGHARSLFMFGRWIFLSTLLTLLVGQSDRLIFAKLVPFEVLGVYGIAAALASLPAEAAQRLGSMVLFPALSRMRGRGDFAHEFARARQPLVLAAGAVTSGILSAGPSLVALLYDSRYLAAGWMLRVLGVAGWLQILEAGNSAANLAAGRANLLALSRAAKLAGMIVLVPVGYRLAGFPGALAGLAASDLLKYAASLAGLRERLGTVAADVGFTVAVAAVAGAAHLAVEAVAASHGSPLAALLAAATVVGALWGGLALVWRRQRDVAIRRTGDAVLP